MMYRWLSAIVVALILSGCATLNLKRPVSDEDLSKSRRVGTVSILGDTFQGISIGTTVFNNTYFSASVPDWNIDKYASNTMLGLLRSSTRFESAELERGGLSVDQLRADDRKRLWDEAEKQAFDRLVIVRPGVSDNHAFVRPGFGFFERSFLGSADRCVYAAYVVEVFDVATRKPLGWEWGGGMPCRLGSDNNFAFKKKFEDYSSTEKQAMRERLELRLSESLRYTLEKLALVPAAGK